MDDVIDHVDAAERQCIMVMQERRRMEFERRLFAAAGAIAETMGATVTVQRDGEEIGTMARVNNGENQADEDSRGGE